MKIVGWEAHSSVWFSLNRITSAVILCCSEIKIYIVKLSLHWFILEQFNDARNHLALTSISFMEILGSFLHKSHT